MAEARAMLLVLLPLVGLLAVGLRRVAGVWGRRIGVALLLVFTAASVFAQVSWSTRDDRDLLNAYDLYHYYIGSRYGAELGTNLLYECTLVADRESERPRLGDVRIVRDLDTYEIVYADEVAKRGVERCAKAFTTARWKSFKRDLGYFRREISKREWTTIMLDRGTNASPIWNLFGGTVARHVPVTQLAWAAAIDIVVLVGLLGCCVWAFGPEAALIAASFVLTCFSTRWPPIGGALFRYDWLAASGIGVCLWLRQRPALSGAAFAYAVGVRIFPLFIVCGLAASAAWKIVRIRTIPSPERRFLIGFGGTMAVLVALAAAVSGPGSFKDFVEKIAVHSASENVSVMRVGLPVAAAWDGEVPATEEQALHLLQVKRRQITDQEPFTRGAALVAALAVVGVAGMRRVRDEGLLLLGVALIPLGLQISYYYYAFLTIPALLHAADLPRKGAALGLTTLCWLNAGAWLATERGVERYTVLAAGSVALCVYAVLLIGGVAWRARADGQAGAQPPALQLGASLTILTPRP